MSMNKFTATTTLLIALVSSGHIAGVCTSGLLADVYCLMTGDVACAKGADQVFYKAKFYFPGFEPN